MLHKVFVIIFVSILYQRVSAMRFFTSIIPVLRTVNLSTHHFTSASGAIVQWRLIVLAMGLSAFIISLRHKYIIVQPLLRQTVTT